jgi:hypothetical protein
LRHQDAGFSCTCGNLRNLQTLSNPVRSKGRVQSGVNLPVVEVEAYALRGVERPEGNPASGEGRVSAPIRTGVRSRLLGTGRNYAPTGKGSIRRGAPRSIGTEGRHGSDGVPAFYVGTPKRRKGRRGARGLSRSRRNGAVRDPLIAFRVATSQAQAEATKATPRSLRLAGAPARSLLRRLNARSSPRPHNQARPHRPRCAPPSFA